MIGVLVRGNIPLILKRLKSFNPELARFLAVVTHIFFDLEGVFLLRVSFRSKSPRNKAFGASANGAI
jgi:hypothetical protein